MKKNSNVLVVTGIYPPQSGGPAIYAKMLVDNSRRYDVIAKPLPLAEVANWPKILGRGMYLLKIIWHSFFSDTIFALDPVSVGLPALAASAVTGKPLVLRLGGDYAWEQGTLLHGVTDSLDDFAARRKGYPKKVLHFKRVQKMVAEHAVRIIVTSKYLKGIVELWGIDSQKISVVYNGFEFEDVLPDKSQLQKELSISPHTVVSIGRLVPWKGFVALVHAMKQVVEKVPDAKLLVIGDGPEKENIERAIQEEGLSESVLLRARISHDMVLKYLKAADLFVLNTNYEGLSHLILEAMSVGTPVLTTDVGGNPELIRSEKEGILIGYDDKQALVREIARLLNDPGLRAVLAANAKQKAEQFKGADTVRHTSEILRDSLQLKE